VTLIAPLDIAEPVTVQTRASVRPSHAFDVIAPIDLSLIFRGWGPFPRRARCAQPNRGLGSGRKLSKSRPLRRLNGDRDSDRVHHRPQVRLRAHRLHQHTEAPHQRRAGRVDVHADGDGTVIRWTYEFKPRRGRRMLVRWILAPLWRYYMQRAVEAAAHLACERNEPTPARDSHAAHPGISEH
jgi:hypothetical protein